MDIRKYLKNSDGGSGGSVVVEELYDAPTTQNQEVHSESVGVRDNEAKYDIPVQPYQPTDLSKIPTQVLNKRTLKFQTDWFTDFKWLHFEPAVGGVLCHICASASQSGLLDLAKCAEPAFISKGFSNWKKAREYFNKHVKSKCHNLASVNIIANSKNKTVDSMIDKQLNSDQKDARHVLTKLITSVRFLAERGLALRGSMEETANYNCLLKLRAEDDQLLEKWLVRSRLKYTSGEIQNEMIEIMAKAVRSRLIEDIRSNVYYGLIVDGTQDVQGLEQEAVCVRYVDANLDVHEIFLGLCNPRSTTGEALCDMILKFLDSCDLNLNDLRAQTYDGASNMAGAHRGCQALLKIKQPLAKYYHCGAHA